MDRAHSTYGGEERYIENFGVSTGGKEITWNNQMQVGRLYNNGS
jgi:hypothetical protein